MAYEEEDRLQEDYKEWKKFVSTHPHKKFYALVRGRYDR